MENISASLKRTTWHFCFYHLSHYMQKGPSGTVPCRPSVSRKSGRSEWCALAQSKTIDNYVMLLKTEADSRKSFIFMHRTHCICLTLLSQILIFHIKHPMQTIQTLISKIYIWPWTTLFAKETMPACDKYPFTNEWLVHTQRPAFEW